jgi:hypothetical protein
MRSPLLEQMADPVEILQRLAVLRGAGRPVPADLTRAVVDWIGGAAPRILDGENPAAALGLAVQPGGRSLARRVRQSRRDAMLADLIEAAPGNLNQRADTALAWIEGAGDAPVELQPIVEAVRTCGLPVPGDVRGIQKAAARATRAGAVIASADCETVSPEAPQPAAIEH